MINEKQEQQRTMEGNDTTGQQQEKELNGDRGGRSIKARRLQMFVVLVVAICTTQLHADSLSEMVLNNRDFYHQKRLRRHETMHNENTIISRFNNKTESTRNKAVCEMKADRRATELLMEEVATKRRVLSTPIINVGMPKMGSSSLHEFFLCAGHNSSHYTCGPRPRGPGKKGPGLRCATCMEQAFQEKRPMLASCGGVSRKNPNGFSAFMQMDYNRPGKTCFFPQMLPYLEVIHRESPNATFVLLSRPLDHWINSLDNWHEYRTRLTKCNLPGLTKGQGRDDEALKEWACNHQSQVRKFVQKHPSHALIELELYETQYNDDVLSQLFLGDRGSQKSGGRCYGHANQNNHKAKA